MQGFVKLLYIIFLLIKIYQNHKFLKKMQSREFLCIIMRFNKDLIDKKSDINAF